MQLITEELHTRPVDCGACKTATYTVSTLTALMILSGFVAFNYRAVCTLL